MRKPKVGDKLFLIEGKYEYSCEVVKVGRKYFTIKYGSNSNLEVQFNIETWREKTEYTSDYLLYESRQHRLDEVEKTYIFQMLRQEFEIGMFRLSNRYSLEQVRRVVKILGIDLKRK